MKTLEKCVILTSVLQQYQALLAASERAESTKQNYLREAAAFLLFVQESAARPGCSEGSAPGTNKVFFHSNLCSRQQVLAYKEHLVNRGLAPATVNARLAACNDFLKRTGHADLTVRPIRCQRRIYCDPDRMLFPEDYRRLCNAASRAQDTRLLPILVTLCGSGIRVSELRFITTDAIRCGRTTIRNKGKYRTLLLSRTLCAFLEDYCRAYNIVSGPLFCSASGRPLERTQIWRMLKSLADDAHVAPEKVFPHNLRHLFARTFYAQEKDLVTLADILGHSSINTTRLYVMNTGDDHRRKLDALGLVP